MQTLSGKLGPLVTAAVLALCACDMVAVYDAQIQRATKAIEAAKNDAQRAAALADRGRNYSDKARLSLLRKQIDHDEYVRLFELSMKDHDQAVTLAPSDAEIHYARGRSNYDRAALADEPVADHTPWFDAARADFAKAVTLDPRHEEAYDFLGLVDEQSGRFDEAVADYTHEMALNHRLGKSRLADLYCNRGQTYLRDKHYELATADLEKAVELWGRTDACACEPYNSLAFLYIDEQQSYDRGWDLVRKARSSGQWIAPEYLERLKKGSGRES